MGGSRPLGGRWAAAAAQHSAVPLGQRGPTASGRRPAPGPSAGAPVRVRWAGPPLPPPASAASPPRRLTRATRLTPHGPAGAPAPVAPGRAGSLGGRTGPRASPAWAVGPLRVPALPRPSVVCGPGGGPYPRPFCATPRRWSRRGPYPCAASLRARAARRRCAGPADAGPGPAAIPPAPSLGHLCGAARLRGRSLAPLPAWVALAPLRAPFGSASLCLGLPRRSSACPRRVPPGGPPFGGFGPGGSLAGGTAGRGPALNRCAPPGSLAAPAGRWAPRAPARVAWWPSRPAGLPLLPW